MIFVFLFNVILFSNSGLMWLKLGVGRMQRRNVTFFPCPLFPGLKLTLQVDFSQTQYVRIPYCILCKWKRGGGGVFCADKYLARKWFSSFSPHILCFQFCPPTTAFHLKKHLEKESWNCPSDVVWPMVPL